MPPPNQQEIVQALHRRDAQALGYLFRCPAQLSNYSTSSTNDMPLPNSSQSVIVHEQEWGGVLQLFFHVYKCAEAGSIVQAYEYQSKLHTSFNQVFGSSVGNWLVPALHTICRDTHKIAVLADKAGEQTQHHSKLENAASLLQESFSRTYNDRKELIPQAPFNEEGSKKIGVLAIVNELFKIYFRLNTLRLCKNLVKPVEVRKLHEPQYTTMGQCVTYKFFVGRLNLFEDQYSEAESNLEFAFKYAHKDALRNKKRILNYLVPVKIYRGRFPSTALLQRYALYEFVPIVDAVQKGDLRSFNDALLKYQDRFIRQGTYLLLEKCKTICYRNLFKRVHAVLGSHQIPLSQVASAFKWLNIDLDLDEIECILSNLIYRGFVRGYLSHTKRVLVLSKRDPFPVSAIIAK